MQCTFLEINDPTWGLLSHDATFFNGPRHNKTTDPSFFSESARMIAWDALFFQSSSERLTESLSSCFWYNFNSARCRVSHDGGDSSRSMFVPKPATTGIVGNKRFRQFAVFVGDGFTPPTVVKRSSFTPDCRKQKSATKSSKAVQVCVDNETPTWYGPCWSHAVCLWWLDRIGSNANCRKTQDSSMRRANQKYVYLHSHYTQLFVASQNASYSLLLALLQCDGIIPFIALVHYIHVQCIVLRFGRFLMGHYKSEKSFWYFVGGSKKSSQHTPSTFDECAARI